MRDIAKKNTDTAYVLFAQFEYNWYLASQMKVLLRILLWLGISAVLTTLFLSSIFLAGNWEKYMPAHTAAGSIGANFCIVALLTIGNYYIIKYVLWPKFTAVRIAEQIVVSFILQCIVCWPFETFLEPPFYRWSASVFTNVLIFLILQIYHYAAKYRHTRNELTRQTLLSMQYRYDRLAARVAPHFLFNSFSALVSLIDTDARQAHDFAVGLSRIYRYMTTADMTEDVSLDEELDFMNSYASVFGKMHEGQFNLETKTGTSIEDKRIIRYSLQLVLENIFKHNIISSKSPMTVNVNIGNDYIQVTNPIIPKPEESGEALGLRYLGELYAKYGHRFTAESSEGIFRVRIPYI